jgi:uncharacterized membrane-anchored protein
MSTLTSRTLYLIVIVLGQLAVLAGIYLGHVYPMWTGKEIRLAVRPVDPRSMFRGNYARLTYSINSPPKTLLKDEGKSLLRAGEVIYAVLTPDRNGIYDAVRYQTTMPTGETFIRGRLENSVNLQSTRSPIQIRIRYGIEAYFAPEERALELQHAVERRQPSRPTVTLMVAPSGKALVTEVNISPSD